jgi:hypothetical protein
MLLMGRTVRKKNDNDPQELLPGPVYKNIGGQFMYFALAVSKMSYRELGTGSRSLAGLAEGDVLNTGTVEK